MSAIEYARNILIGTGNAPEFAHENGRGMVETTTCIRDVCRNGSTYPVLQPITRYNRTYMRCPKCEATYGEVVQKADVAELAPSGAQPARLCLSQRAKQDDKPVLHLSFDLIRPGEPRGKPVNIAIPEDDARSLRNALVRQLGAP